MSKQRMVIKLPIEDKKKRTKALKTAAGVEGVISVELADDNQLVLVGDGTDVVQLTTRLRKKLGHADVISVTSVDGNFAEEEKEDGENTISTSPQNYHQNGVPSRYFYPYDDPYFQWCIEYK